MLTKQEAKEKLNKRLMPLYISAFFQSFVLWYAVEKLFMRSIGFDNTAIGFMIAVYSAVMLIVETPSGILADRWSRKGVLMLASICLSVSALVGGLSHGISSYLICAVLWGIFFACYSGMYDSIIYDTIAESAPDSKLFDYLYGRVQLLDSAGLVLSSLAGALIATSINLRASYFLTIPFVLIPIIALMQFKEPTLHKQQVVIPLQGQIGITLQAVVRNRSLLPVIIVLILRSIVIYCIYEFAQLWLLALHTPTAYYGIANAVLLSSIGLGGILVSRLQLSRYNHVLLTLVTILFGCLGLIIFRSTVNIVGSGSIFASGLISINIIFSRILHDNLSPSIRAGAASATNTMGRFLIIPTALLFGYASQRFTIYKAAFILFGLTVVMSLFVVVVANRNNRTGLEPN
jgi:MFS family permease